MVAITDSTTESNVAKAKQIHINTDNYLRQLDFYDPSVHQPKVTVIGAGGIGSQVVVSLAKLGVQQITVYDQDTIETHNVSTTPYSPKDIGKPKVVALQNIVKMLGGPDIKVYNRKWQEGTEFPKTDILISGVDSAPVRLAMFKAAYAQKIPCFIDGRIGGVQLRVYTLNMKDAEDRQHYLKTIPKPGREAQLPCTGQQVWDVGVTIAGFMTRAVRLWMARGVYNFEIIHYQDTLQTSVSDRKSHLPPGQMPFDPRQHLVIPGGVGGVPDAVSALSQMGGAL